MGSQNQDHFVNLEQRRDREVSVHTTDTSRSQFRSGSYLSHEESTRAMQWVIDHLKRKLHHERRRRAPSNSDFSSGNEEDGSYNLGLELLVNPSRVMSITTVSVGVGARLAKAWEMML